MQDIANTTLSGNLTRDVDLRQLPSGADVARLRVATTTRRRNGEEWVDKTNYLTVEVFGAQARACAQYLTKGSRVFVDSEPDWREWTDRRATAAKRSPSKHGTSCSKAPGANRTPAPTVPTSPRPLPRRLRSRNRPRAHPPAA